MPEKIKLADGTEREVPTNEEIETFNSNAKELETLKSLKEEVEIIKNSLEIKEGESLQEKVQSMKDNENPNWKKAQNKIKILEKIAKENGKEINEEGELVEEREALSAEDIARIAVETYKKEEGAKKTESLINSIEKEEDRESVKAVMDKYVNDHNFDAERAFKLAKEEVLPDNKPDNVKDAFSTASGQPPVISMDGQNKPSFSETDSGRNLAKALNLSFINKEDNNKNNQ